MGKNDVTIRILGEPNHIKKVFAEVGDAGQKMASRFAGVGRTIGIGMAAGLGVAGVAMGALVGDGVRSLVEIERIGKQSEAAIKSTGGAAGVSARDVRALAEEIEGFTGIEAEAVQEGENLLLTFTNIQNKAGAGNNIFDQATQILTDMSVAMGTDVKAGAVQLGKALNDPVKGVTALTKVGVTFTEQQKKQIEAMAEAGNVAGAQKIILAELQ